MRLWGPMCGAVNKPVQITPRVLWAVALQFEWDPGKAAANLARHGVSFEEAATVFGDPLGHFVADLRHSSEEDSP